MKIRTNKTDLGILSPLLLFTVFAVCVIMVLLTGAGIYNNHTLQNQTSYDHRTVAQYLTTRVRQSAARESCFVGYFHSSEAREQGNTLFFCETFGDEVYYTRIYCHDGYLYELFSLASDPFEPADGERILPVGDLYFTESDGEMTIDVEYSDGTEQSLLFHMRGEVEVFQ